jgi:hypothetical protein
MRRELIETLCRISLVLTLATLGALIAIDLHLRKPVSPQGIVSFELCAYAGLCRAIVEAWGPVGQLVASSASATIWRGLNERSEGIHHPDDRLEATAS